MAETQRGIRAEKAREARLRRMAARLGLKLMKSRTRNPWVSHYGRYFIVDPHTNTLVTSESGLDLDQVETYLTEEDS